MSKMLNVPLTAKGKAYRLLTNGSTVAAFSNPISTTTEPATVDASVGVIPVARNLLFLTPFGAGGDGTTFDVRFFGWELADDLWVPHFLLELTCTLSTQVGVAGAEVVATERFADTIAAAPTLTGVDTAKVVSPGNNVIGSVLLDALGFSYISAHFDMTGATNGNFLYRYL